MEGGGGLIKIFFCHLTFIFNILPKLSLKVPTSLVGLLRGREGHKQKKVEETFRCKINFPKKHGAGGETEISEFSK